MEVGGNFSQRITFVDFGGAESNVHQGQYFQFGKH